MYSNFFGCKSTNSGRKIMLFLFLPPPRSILIFLVHITSCIPAEKSIIVYSMFSPAPIIQSLLEKKKKTHTHTHTHTHNVYPCKPQLNYIKVEFEGWGEGLDNIRRLGLRMVYIKTYLCQRKNNVNVFLVSQEDPYLRFFLRFFIVVGWLTDS